MFRQACATLLLTALLFPVTATAASFTVLLDSDRNPATGCPVTQPILAGVARAELRVDVEVDVTAAPPVVSSLSYAACTGPGGAFAPPSSGGEAALGFDNGIDAADVIEVGLANADLGLPPNATVGISVISVDTASGLGTGAVLASVPAVTLPPPPLTQSTPVPAAQTFGLFLLALLLAGLALWYLPRNAAAALVLLAGSGWILLAWAASIVVDGQVDDWAGARPVVSLPAGNSSPPETDVRQLFVAQDDARVYFRLDVTQLDVRPAAQPATVTSIGTTGVALAWPEVPGARSYRVLRCDVPLSDPSVPYDPSTNLCDGTAQNPFDPATCTVIETRTTPSFTETQNSQYGYCYTLQACSDPAGTQCGAPGQALQYARVPETFATAFVSGPARTYSGQQTILHGYARNTSGAVTYDWKRPGGVALCPGTTRTAQDLCFVAPTVTANQRLEFDFDVFEDGAFAVKAKISVTVEPTGNVILTTRDTRLLQPGQKVTLHVQGAGGSNFQWVQTGPVDPTTGQIPPGLQVTLAGANTDNPSFIAPPGLNKNSVIFQVTYTDNTGRSTAERYEIGGQPAGTTTTGQPMKTAQSGTQLAPTPLAPQQLTLIPPPPVPAISGAPVNLTMTAVHGDSALPYDWSWVRTEGPDVPLLGADTSLLSFTAPDVTAPTRMTFEATVSNGGQTRTGVATVNVAPPPSQVPPPATPPLQAVQAPTLVPTGGSATIATRLANPVATQTGGPDLGLPPGASLPGTPGPGGTTTFPVTPPPNLTTSATIEITVTGTNANGDTVQERYPVQVQPTPQPPAPVQTQAPAGGNLLIGTNLLNATITPTGNTVFGRLTPVPRPGGGTDFLIEGNGKSGDRMTFEVTGTDPVTGQPVTELHEVLVVPAGGSGTGIPTTAPSTVTAEPGKALQLGTSLTNAQVRQTGGIQVVVGPVKPKPDGSGSTYTVTPVSGGGSSGGGSHTAELTITGRNAAGEVVQEIVHIEVTPPRPPQPLTVSVPANIEVAERTAGFAVGATASGGTPPYAFSWVDTSGILQNLQGAATATVRFDTPRVSSDTTAVLQVTVNGQVTDVPVLVRNAPALTLAPVANRTVAAGETFSLAASASGGVAPYAWQWTQLTGSATISGENTPTLQVTAPLVTATTTLQFRVDVTDAAPGDTSSATVDVTVVPLSVAAIPPRTVDEGKAGTVAVSATGGSGSYSYQWTYVPVAGVPTDLTLTNVTSDTVAFVAPQVDAVGGDFILRVTVSDGFASATADAAVSVRDLSPPFELVDRADIEVLVGETARASVQYTGGVPPVDGWQWTLVSAPPAAAPPSLSGVDTEVLTVSNLLAAGEVVLSVSARDGSSVPQAATAEVRITVLDPPVVAQPLKVTFPTATEVQERNGVTVTATAVYGDGPPYDFAWSDPSGRLTLADTDQATVSVTAPAVTADETVQLQLVVDGTAPRNVPVTIRNLPPLAVAPIGDRTVAAGQSFTLSATATGGVAPYAYQWTQVSGSAAISGDSTDTLQVTAPDVTATTTLQFQVAVTDKAPGETAQLAQPVEVTVVPLSLAPIAAQTVDEGASASVTVAATGGSGSYSYQWQYLRGPGAPADLPLTGADTASVGFTAPLVAGDAQFTLRATVGDGLFTRSTDVVVTVRDLAPPFSLAAPVKSIETGDSVTLTVHAQGGVPPYRNFKWILASDPAYQPGAISGTDTDTVTLTAPATAGSLLFDVSAEDSSTVPQTASVQVAVPVTLSQSTPVPPPVVPPQSQLPAQTAPDLSLTVWNCGSQRAEAAQADEVVLGVCARGGSGFFDYQWSFQGSSPDIGTQIVLRDADTSHARFTAPAITEHRVALAFDVTVTDQQDPALSKRIVILSALYNVAGGADPDAPAQTVEIAPGQVVTLHAPAPFGGVAPYSYRLDGIVDADGNVVVPGPINLDLEKGTFEFTPPPGDGTYTASMTTTDAVGNTQTDKTEVKAETPKPLSVGLSPQPVPPATSTPVPTEQVKLTLNATASGGTGPYTYAWKWQCSAVNPLGRVPLPGGGVAGSGDGSTKWCTSTAEQTASETGPTYTINLPYVTCSGDVDITVTVTVSDSATPANSVSRTSVIKATRNGPAGSECSAGGSSSGPTPPVNGGSLCAVCGDWEGDPKRECSRIDLIVRKTERCPDTKPYCMNDILQDSNGTAKLFKRCADEAEVKELWFMQSSDKVACFKYDPSTIRGELVCHLGCYGDNCNSDILPPTETLYQP